MLALTVLTLFDVVFISGGAILTMQASYVRRHARSAGMVAIAGLARSAALWTWFGLAFGVFCALAGEPLASVVAPGFSPAARALFAHCCMLGALLPAASALMVFASALNRINGREVLYTVNPLMINGLSWLAVVVASRFGVDSLEIVRLLLLTIVIATLLMFAWQLACMEASQRRRVGVHYLRGLTPRRLVRRISLHKRELRLVSPIVGALLIQQVVTLISYGFATRAGSGFLLLFGLAERLTNVIFSVFIMTFLTVLEPRWARASVTPGGADEIASDVAVICAALIPVTATLMFAGDSLAMLLFGRGAVSAHDLGELADITRVYALSLPGLSLGVVLSRLLVIRNAGRRIFVVNVCVTLLHFALCAGLFAIGGARGVAAAIAITLGIQAVAFGAFLARSSSERARGNRALVMRLAALALLVSGVGWLTSQLEVTPLLHVLVAATATLVTTIAGAPLLGLRLKDNVLRVIRL